LGFKSLRIIVSGLLTGRKQSIETVRTLAGKKFNLLNLPLPCSSHPKRTGIGTYGIIWQGITPMAIGAKQLTTEFRRGVVGAFGHFPYYSGVYSI
jgi:hypothetical protein